MSLPQGIVLVRPDACYTTVLDGGLPGTLRAGVLSASCSASCASYIGGRALQKNQPDDRLIIGGTEQAAKIAAIVNEEVDTGGSYSGALPFDGVLWNIFLRLVREQFRDPAVLDYAGDLLGRTL